MTFTIHSDYYTKQKLKEKFHILPVTLIAYNALTTKFLDKQTKTPNTSQDPNNSYCLPRTLKAMQIAADLLLHFGEQYLFCSRMVVSKIARIPNYMGYSEHKGCAR